MGSIGGLYADERGQMSVELAVLMPVVVVVSLTVYNLARFVCLSATFDRVALDAAVSQGVATVGANSCARAQEAVRACVQDAIGEGCRVEVVCERGSTTASGTLSLSPSLTRFTCTLLVKPWPSSFVIAGTAFDPPFALRHERSVVIDRYRSGVVM